MMRLSIALIVLAASVQSASAQPASAEPRDDTSYEVIDSPPLPQPAPPGTAPGGVILERPGQVLLSGTPIKVRFQSPTDGISFHLRLGGTYSSISGVSFGVGGWGGYGLRHPE